MADSGFTAVFVNYTPSPEAHYPTAINEIYAAAKWVAAHGEEIKVDGKTARHRGQQRRRKHDGGRRAHGAAQGRAGLQMPGHALAGHGREFRHRLLPGIRDGYFLSRPMMKWFWDAYAPNAEQRREIYASPLQATTEQLKGLPPALVQVAGNDVLRDEGLAYARKLDAAGVDVTVVRYENLIHDYGLLNAISQVPAVRDALHQVAETLKKHLE